VNLGALPEIWQAVGCADSLRWHWRPAYSTGDRRIVFRARRQEVIVRTLANKIVAAFEHGKMDFYAGFPRDPRRPLIVYSDLTEEEQSPRDERVGGWMG